MVPASYIGQQVVCPSCRQHVFVPVPATVRDSRSLDTSDNALEWVLATAVVVFLLVVISIVAMLSL